MAQHKRRREIAVLMSSLIAVGDLCSGVKTGSRRKTTFGMDAAVSRVLPVASTTGMSVSVPLPGTAMLVCSSFQMNNRHHWLKEDGGKKHRGALCWGRVFLFFFPFSFIFLQRHSWLLPHWWWLVSVYSRARWPDWLPSPWHQAPWLPALSVRRHNITDSSVSRPSSGLNPRLHQRLGRRSSSFYWSAIVFFKHPQSQWFDTRGMQAVFFWMTP